ncbi:MAG: hypothetical protein IKB90_06880 [Alistipes sp.]|nr:hypothetical protein [Alistipes sp.]
MSAIKAIAITNLEIIFESCIIVGEFLLNLQKEKSRGARDREFRENREYKEFSDAPIPKFTHFSKLTNFTKKQ